MKKTLRVITQNGHPLWLAERAPRQKLWLEYCASLEAELGPCTSVTVEAYRERLEQFDKSHPELAKEATVSFPRTPLQLRTLLEKIGAYAIVMEVSDVEALAVAHVE